MAVAVKDLKRKSKRANLRLFGGYKRIYQYFRGNHNDQKKILFIVGCQRSGTTLMTRIFKRDIHTRVFGEFSRISNQDPDNIRLNPLHRVKEQLKDENADFIIGKPLVESQRIREILDYFEESRAIWMFRHYKDVAFSNLNRFGEGNGLDDLEPIAWKMPFNWRTELISEATQEQIIKIFDKNMSPLDAAAWFWWVRNRIFFEHNLYDDQRIKLVKYEDLAIQPQKIMKEIYRFSGAPYPGDQILSEISPGSVGKASDQQLSLEVADKCEEMWLELNKKYELQNNR